MVSHLFPFRTEKLSPLAPMVLHSNAGEEAAAFFYKLKPWRQRCLQGSFVFILSFFCVIFGIPFALFCLLLCYLRNPFCFILSSFRIVFGAFLCLFRLFPVLPSESFGVAPVFSLCYLRNPLVFILSFFRIAFGALLCLYCFCFVLILFLFIFCVVFKSYLCFLRLIFI